MQEIDAKKKKKKANISDEHGLFAGMKSTLEDDKIKSWYEKRNLSIDG